MSVAIPFWDIYQRYRIRRAWRVGIRLEGLAEHVRMGRHSKNRDWHRCNIFNRQLCDQGMDLICRYQKRRVEQPKIGVCLRQYRIVQLPWVARCQPQVHDGAFVRFVEVPRRKVYLHDEITVGRYAVAKVRGHLDGGAAGRPFRDQRGIGGDVADHAIG